MWLQAAGQPVASAVHLLRPCNTAELLAWQVRSRSMRPTAAPTQGAADGEQEGFIDARDVDVPVPGHDDESVGSKSGDEVPRSSGLIPTDAPMPPANASGEHKRRRKQRIQQAATPRSATAGADTVDDLLSPLERHLDNTSVPVDDPGRRLIQSLASSSTAYTAAETGAAPKSSGHTEAGADFVSTTANMHVADDDDVKYRLTEFHAAQAFFSERIPTPIAEAYAASQGKPKARQRAALEKRGKLLTYGRLSEDLQRLLDKSRLKEWNNYLSFGAARIISKAEAKQLVARGAEELPTQWIERDNNEFKRLKDEHVEPDMKSRLVARGDLSKVWARSDSPTADKEAVFLVFSFAASRRLRLKSGDLDHGYFQGERLSTPLILRQPA